MVDGDITEGIILPEELEKLEKQKKQASEHVKELQDKRLDDAYNNGKVTFSEVSRKQYEKTYGLVGNHSGVQVCHWTKKAMKEGEAHCYKQKFYGIDCHNCAQMSPALAWCTEACVFCWRPSEWMKKTTFGEQEIDDPDFIIEETVRVRRKLISGLRGAKNAHEQNFKEAFYGFPSHWAISLSGEPTIYPRLGELIKKLKAKNEVKSVFVVTNGQEPQHLEKLANDNALPTQLYLSLTAPNAFMFKRINRSIYPDGWERLNRTLELMPKLDCRKVIRCTVIKNVNDQDEHIPVFAQLIEKSKTDFLEIKSYMALGFSRKRLGVNNVLTHEEIKVHGEKLLQYLPEYMLIDEDPQSHIVLLKRRNSPYENLIARKGASDIEKTIRDSADLNG